MNNNFKKLLASAMALAMVTSVMPAVTTETHASLIGNVCEGANFTTIKPVLEYILNPNLSLSDLETTIFAETEVDAAHQTIVDYINEPGYMDVFKKAVGCADETELEKVEYFYKAAKAYADYRNFSASGVVINSAADFVKANADLEGLQELYTVYNGNLTNDERDLIGRKIDILEEKIENSKYDITDELKDYVEDLENKLKEFVEKETSGTDVNDRNSITKSELTDFIKKEKAEANYKVFGKEEPVEEFFEELNTWFDEIENVQAAVNKKNEAYKALTEVVKKVGNDYEGKNVINELTMADWEVYKDFKEEVVDVIYTVESEKFASKYYNASAKSYFVTNQELISAMNTFNGGLKTTLNDKAQSNSYLVSLYDSKTGEFGWDVLEAHMEKVIESYNLIDVELNKLVAKNLTKSDGELISKLDDAYDYLTHEGKGNLTSAESKVVRRAERTIDELYEAYRVKFGSLTGATGWVDMGNGNWKYFEEDGTAPTKWICTAKDTWYYVSNGVMLRDAWVWRDSESAYYVGNNGKMVYGPTTVKGYELDANGLWHK